MRLRYWRGFGIILFFLGLLTFPPLILPKGASAEVKLEVLDPRGELYTLPVQPINPRLSSLAGKKIGIMNNGKPGADAFQPHLEKALKAVVPDVQLRTWGIAYNVYPDKAKDLKAVAEWSDAVIGLLGD
jgi:hypothetical protein